MITAGPVVLFDYAAGDAVIRNIALTVLRQLGFSGRAVAAACARAAGADPGLQALCLGT